MTTDAGSASAVYVSHAGSGELRVFRLAADDGVLVQVQSLPVGGQLMPLALAPDRRFLYAARRSEPLEVLSFAVQPTDGRLTPIGAAALRHSMAGLATDRSGRFLFSASYGGDLIAVSPIGVDGVAHEAQQVLPTLPKAHAIGVDPSNRFVFATSLGGGALLQFRFDAESGRLAPNDPPALAPHPGASPRHFVFAADGRFVYLLGELDGQIDVLVLDDVAGTLRRIQTLSALPPSPTGDPWAADLHLTPDGRFLYASERRSGTLAAFSVNLAAGRLTGLGHFATEAEPRGFNVAPDGRHLVVAGQASDHLSVHAIDAQTGALRPAHRLPTGAGPNWVESIALPGFEPQVGIAKSGSRNPVPFDPAPVMRERLR